MSMHIESECGSGRRLLRAGFLDGSVAVGLQGPEVRPAEEAARIPGDDEVST